MSTCIHIEGDEKVNRRRLLAEEDREHQTIYNATLIGKPTCKASNTADTHGVGMRQVES